MTENPRLKAAFEKGRKAALEGKRRTACPYGDLRTYHGAVTWSRGYIRAWLEGYDSDRTETEAKS